ncbi:MAG: hypothetical protein PHP42_00940 [Bacteroidota bacterium]|nr:hypothetical protein [Bacteroidota bacterium]
MTMFMVETRLPIAPGTEFFSLIPAQRLKVAELMTRKKIVSYTLSADRSKLWIVMNGESEEEARRILAEQPMDKYFYYTFHELMFHEMAGAMFPSVSLN